MMKTIKTGTQISIGCLGRERGQSETIFYYILSLDIFRQQTRSSRAVGMPQSSNGRTDK